MTISQADILAVKTKIAPLFGQKLLSATVDEDKIVDLEFGAEVNPIPQNQSLPEDRLAPELGETWHLLTDFCAWRIEKNNVLLAGCSDEDADLKAFFKEFKSKTLVSVELFPPLWDTLFSFEDGFTLRTFSVSSDRELHWLLFFPDGRVLKTGPGMSWSCDRNYEPYLHPPNLDNS